MKLYLLSRIFLPEALRKHTRAIIISCFLIFTVLWNAMATPVNEQDVFEIKAENATVRDILKTVENKTDYRFFFSADFAGIHKKVFVDMKTDNVAGLLSGLFADGAISYRILGDHVVVISPVAEAQQGIEVSGTVVDDAGGPIPGVNVMVKGTTTGVATDIDGKYSLKAPNAGAVLVFSFVGYATQEVTVGTQTTINVTLSEDTKRLDEVVVIGYGTQTRRELTGSVTSINQEDFNKGVTQTADDLLQGKVAGLTISRGSGDVMDGSNIRLRGVNTLMNDTGPFIVIDGVPGGDLNTVPPQDIESISVLKDASAAAIYGSRSAGGVIMITTKRGSGSKLLVSYDGYVAMDLVANKPDMITADQWRQYMSDKQLDPSAYDKYNASTDWYDEIMRTGFTQNHTVSLSGGGTKNNYRISTSYMDRQGIARDNFVNRVNFNFNFSQRAINDRLRIGITGSATLREGQRGNRSNFVLATNMLPVYPVKLDDGSWFDTKDYDQGNPVRNIEYNSNTQESNYFYGNIFGELTVLDGLVAKLSVYKSRWMTDISNFNDAQTQAGRDDGGFAKRESRTTDREVLEFTLNYTKSFNDKHKLDVLAGYSWEENTTQTAFAQNRNFVTSYVGPNSLQSGQGLRTGDVNSSKNMYRLISFYGRVNYSYLSKYMLTATLREDGSSKFGANHKWGLFPSVSAAWNITDEDFMPDIKWLDALKLRAGYGVTGNQDGLSPYKTLELYASDGIYLNTGKWLSAYKISQNANPDLKWESTASFDIGLDFQLLNNKLGGSIEWYSKKTSDMLYTYDVPSPPLVYNKIVANVGDMTNKGVEITLNWNTLKRKDFNWSMTLTAAYNKNKVVKLSNDLYTTKIVRFGDAWIRGGSSDYTSVISEGHQMGEFYGWLCDGIGPDGKYIFRDLDGEPGMGDADRTYMGKPFPDWTGGWQNTLTYKHWDLSIFFRGQFGNQIVNHGRMAYANPANLPGANARAEALTIGLTEVPKYCSFYVENGDFVRLDNMSLGYTFDTGKINWINSFRVYVTGQNLFVITGYNGLDPEVDMTANIPDNKAPGVESRDFYPKARTFSLGVSLSF